MSFIDEVYKPVDPYIKEKTFVHNLRFAEAVKTTVVNNKATRRLEGYLYSYHEDYGDSYSMIHPKLYNRYPDIYYNGDSYHAGEAVPSEYKYYNWNFIENLLKKEIKDIGFRAYEVKVLARVEQFRIRDGFNFFHKQKYKEVPIRFHYIWIKASW